MNTPLKLRVDFANKTFDGEGDPALVEKLFQEFSERVSRAQARAAPPAHDPEQDAEIERADSIEDAVKIRRRRRAAKTSGSKAEKVADYAPTRLNQLDLSKLDAFYAPWDPRNHAERILLFSVFLEEELKTSPCSADHVYTCYLHLREKMPEAFIQAFRDASGNKHGFIQYNSPNDITVTIAGRNHLSQGKIRRKEGTVAKG